MNWPPRLSHSLFSSTACDSLLPLLSPYADGQASPEEGRRVEAHLSGCDSCREALSWMQATHRTLAARPVALPPPDLHSRIALAIAASDAAPARRPILAFTMPPAYAAAASLTALGIALSYPLWHGTSQSVKPALPSVQVASKPPLAKPPLAKTSPAALLHTHSVKTPRAQVAANIPHDVPEIVKPGTVIKRPAVGRVLAPRVSLPPEQLATAAAKAPSAPQTAPFVVKMPPKAPLRRLPAAQTVALGHIPSMMTKSAPHLPSPVKEAPKAPPAVQVATLPPAHTPDPVQVHILPPVKTQDPETKIAAVPRSSDSIMAGVSTYAKQMQTVALRSVALDTTRQSARTATAAMHSVDAEHFGFYGAVYSGTANK